MRMDFIQTAHADRFVAVGLDQLSDELAGGVVVGGVELHRALGLPPCGRGQCVGRQRAEGLDQPRSGGQQIGQGGLHQGPACTYRYSAGPM
jgi:hypothetical protein